MVGFRGLSLDPHSTIAQDLRQRRVGGVILYRTDVPSGGGPRNIDSPEQVRALVGQLRAHADGPLLIAVDQEGGRVRRLGARFGLGPEPTPHMLGANNDLRTTRRWASATASTLASLGINLNFAPVVDLNLNPASPAIGAHGRSLGTDPNRVVEHARVIIEAHRQHGVLTSLKHYPGHGSADVDSHAGLPDVTDLWREVELDPFRRLIAKGLADSVMVAHLFHRRLDPAHPATLSAPILERLRRELGYQGVVFSDDLQMVAIRQRYPEEEAIRRALQAGVDVLMFSNNSVYDEHVVERVIGLVKGMIRRGELSPSVVERAYRRVVALKARI